MLGQLDVPAGPAGLLSDRPGGSPVMCHLTNPGPGRLPAMPGSDSDHESGEGQEQVSQQVPPDQAEPESQRLPRIIPLEPELTTRNKDQNEERREDAGSDGD
jgi:hypothetical protein